MANAALNHSWPALSKLWLKRWAFKRGKRAGGERQAPTTQAGLPGQPAHGPASGLSSACLRHRLCLNQPQILCPWGPLEHHRCVGSFLSKGKCLPRLIQEVFSGGKFAGGENLPQNSLRQPGGFLEVPNVFCSQRAAGPRRIKGEEA